jgi:hypothetical protein
MSRDCEDFGHLFDRNAGVIDLKDVIDKRPVNVVMLDGLEAMDAVSRAKTFNFIFGDAYKRQKSAIHQEQQKLQARQDSTGMPLVDLCDHGIKDEYHGMSETQGKCLVCGKLSFSV